MGQKPSPTGFRLVLKKNWKSVWFANKQEFGSLLQEDLVIRRFLIKKPCCVGTSEIKIKRMSEKIEVTLHTARPVPRRLQDKHYSGAKRLGRGEGYTYAHDAADAIAKQLERRVAFRRVMKKAIQASMDAGAAGIKIAVSGRIGGAEIARTEWYKEGRIPLHTLRANIDYATGRAETTYGSIGVKVWINKGDQNN